MRIRPGEAHVETATAEAPEGLGRYSSLLFSHTGGLTQFGAFVETLAAGARSSDRHWDETEDEFLLMLNGRAVLVEDAGEPNGHMIANCSDAPCRYLAVGARNSEDIVHYSDIDKILIRSAGGHRLVRRDGTPIERRPQRRTP